MILKESQLFKKLQYLIGEALYISYKNGNDPKNEQKELDKLIQKYIKKINDI